ncbi:preprotein translocase subunit SecA [Lignipirellula cremea]|uniref:Protein translocase subunit SecA n=1 Tax=Lignipirellula cremea TaxID=2528010 RepID=A0A518E4L4_9BACT|nr:preprotein translocase subunit SecA [Lignipirellula cremea]QDU99019.1 preprotein translocase subunit SecA [Lignipirellula cremea]
MTSPWTALWRTFLPGAAPPARRHAEWIRQIRAASTALATLSDGELAVRMTSLRERVEHGQAVTEPNILLPVFALVAAAAQRVLGIDLYDSQLLGGIVLAQGSIAEMQTGEGKTFAALLPAALHALTGQGVHVMTVNPYLAERDYALLAPVHQLLGLSVGMIQAESEPGEKRAAYACDITYGPGYEFGFDYLRDQVALLSQKKPRLGDEFQQRLQGRTPDKPQLMQRGRAVAIVDEADSVMLDEATTPLVLALGGNDPAPNAETYLLARQAAGRLEADRHFVLDPAASTLQLTQAGVELLATPEFASPRRGLDRPWRVYVEQALRADHLYRADVHYILREGEVQIVDQSTGRIFTDRSWRDGLQQAVQAKENLTITVESHSIARITRQRYFQLYDHLCGMTGTAQGSERELRDVYGLDVAVIPPHRPCQRRTLPLRLFTDVAAKERAIVEEIARLHALGQPVLVGAAAIEISERLAQQLAELQVPCQLLNGKQDADEAAIIAQAGALGAVTIATNMAGRGTDISLGPGAAAAGGLHVIATEPQESARIDRQLMGRAARQGDPGSCQLFTALDDSLYRIKSVNITPPGTADAHGEFPHATSAGSVIAHTQRQLEKTLAHVRRNLYAHDDWLEKVLQELV